MEETIKIPIGDKIISLKVQEFDTDVKVDDILRIDYANIMGEILTFPVLLNRIGLMRADVEEWVSKQKMEVEIKEATLREYYRKKLTRIENEKQKSPTIPEIDGAIIMDQAFQNLKKILFRKQRDLEYINSLYWAARSKDDKLNKFSSSLKPEEHAQDILSGTINGIAIRVRDSLIK